MLSHRHKCKLIVLPDRIDIRNRDSFGLFEIAEIIFKNIRKLSFFMISDNNVNCGILLQTVTRIVHIAACRNYNCIRVHLFRPVKHLPRLAIRDIRHSTCIDHIYVCARRKRCLLISCGQKALAHGISLI